MRRVTSVLSLAVAVIVGSAVVAGCGRLGVPGQPGSSGPLWPSGRTFLSTSVTEGGQDRPLVAGTRITLTFMGTDKVGAQAGCNQMGGTARLEGDRLVVSDLAMTEMGCDPPRMQQDTWLAAFLTAKPALRLTGDDLTLTGGLSTGAVEIRLTDRRILDPDRPLTATRWEVDTIISGETASSVPGADTAYLVFDGRGGFTGSTGCATISGSATVLGTQITVAVSGTPTCTGGAALTLHNAVLATLSGSVGYQIEGPRLTLSGPGGAGLGLHEAA